jgi:K+-transporting ATPase A subunit
VLLVTKPVGLYLYKIFNGERTWLSPVFVPVERFFYRLSGVNPEEEQSWVGDTRQGWVLWAVSAIVGTALIVVALTYLPIVALGPIIEQLRL